MDIVTLGKNMQLLGLFFSFISVLVTAYLLFLHLVHNLPVLMPIAALLGIVYLTAGYLLMIGKKAGLALGIFVAAVTVGTAGYFLADHYFSGQFSSTHIVLDILMLGFSLLAFLIGLSQSPHRHESDNTTPQP